MSGKSLLATIGNTPLVEIPLDMTAKIYAKLEYTNPSGSIKDRIASHMVAEARRHKLIRDGGTIIGASTGNQGIALAMVAAVNGYKALICVYQKISPEKLQAIKTYGAQAIKYSSTPNIGDPESYYSQAVALTRTIPDSFMINQYYNQANPQAHYRTTGPEIWQQTEGKITHLFAAAATGGTLTGVGKFLKEKNPRIMIIGVDSVHSHRSTEGNPQPYALEGIGVDFDSPFLNPAYIDTFVGVTDREAFTAAAWLSTSKGILASPSSGAVMHAVNVYRPKLTKDDCCVMIFGDSGTAYLSKLKAYQAVKLYRDQGEKPQAPSHHIP